MPRAASIFDRPALSLRRSDTGEVLKTHTFKPEIQCVV